MRICLETLSCDQRTGIGRIVRALAHEFVARGNDVHIVTHDPGVLDAAIHTHNVMGFPRSKALSKILFRYGERRHLRSLNADVAYSFGVGRWADVVAAQSCHRAGMEILGTHSLALWEQRAWGLYDMISLSDEKALLTSKQERRIIACSNLVKDQLVHYYGVGPERIVVIPNGIEPRPSETPTETSTLLREQLGLVSEEKVLLFMGNEFARKGLHTVIEAMARLAMPGLRLVVAGGGYRRPFERLAAALGIEDRVTFLGKVAEPEQLFGVADLFVFPSLYEPFGMVVLEAMAAGVPVITSRACGATEGMRHGLHGIFLDDPTSAGEVAEWVRTLLADDVLSRKISREGKIIASQFCWDAIAERTLEVLEGARAAQQSL